MLASRRPAATSWLRVRKNGFPERMSSGARVGCSESPTAGIGIRPLPRCGVRVAITGLVSQPHEGVEGGLALPSDGQEARLPAGQATLVAEQEPEHHRDARVSTGD